MEILEMVKRLYDSVADDTYSEFMDSLSDDELAKMHKFGGVLIQSVLAQLTKRELESNSETNQEEEVDSTKDFEEIVKITNAKNGRSLFEISKTQGVYFAGIVEKGQVTAIELDEQELEKIFEGIGKELNKPIFFD